MIKLQRYKNSQNVECVSDQYKNYLYRELLYKLATIEATRSTSMCPLVTHKNNMTRLDAQLLSYYSILFSYSVISLMRNRLRCQLFLI